MKNIYKKPTANIILNGEKLRAFSLRSGKRKRYPSHHCFFNMLLEVLPIAVKQEGKMKGIQNGKEEIELFDCR